MKSFGPRPWILPQPVLIIGTYDKEGKPNAMNAAWGGQWDMHEIIISLGSHQTTDILAENPEFTVTFATADTMIAMWVSLVVGTLPTRWRKRRENRRASLNKIRSNKKKDKSAKGII